MRALLRHIELYLSAAGIIVILVMPLIIESNSLSSWQIAAITATLVGVLHGFIFWVVRNKQRQVRNEALKEVRAMLNDVINNNLAVISLVSRSYGGESEKAQVAAGETNKAIQNISQALETISEESLRSWKARY